VKTPGPLAMILSPLLLFAVGFASSNRLAEWEARHLRFVCPACGVQFAGSAEDVRKARSWYWRKQSYKRLMCPHGHTAWARVAGLSDD
jgi:hypothetical protein